VTSPAFPLGCSLLGRGEATVRTWHTLTLLSARLCSKVTPTWIGHNFAERNRRAIAKKRG